MQTQRLMRALLVTRYVFGYLAAGFLVSVPITVGSRVGYGTSLREALTESALSCGYGVVCLVPFLALIPATRFDWSEMRVPEFQLFELAVSRWAVLAGGALFCASLVLNPTAERGWIEPRIFWTVLVLMALAWGKIKLQTLIFPDFYAPRRERPPDERRG